jgi:hypothetical protein
VAQNTEPGPLLHAPAATHKQRLGQSGWAAKRSGWLWFACTERFSQWWA